MSIEERYDRELKILDRDIQVQQKAFIEAHEEILRLYQVRFNLITNKEEYFKKLDIKLK